MTGAVIPAGQKNSAPLPDRTVEWRVSSVAPTVVVEILPGLAPGMVRTIAAVFVEDNAPLTSTKGEEAIARTRIIAAAPTLLTALAELVAITGPFVRTGVSSPRIIAAHHAAAAAISQATGS